MEKGEKTREFIITKAAELFNQKGYSGSSLSDITELTGIKKGGIYRHFSSKDEIAFEAFSYAGSIVGARLAHAVNQQETASGKLLAYLRVYENVVEDPPFIGGCPLLNTAIDCDDSHPGLRERAKQALIETLESKKKIISEGVQSGEFKADLDIEALATFSLSIMEGGIMMSKLEGNNRHIQMNIKSFANYLEKECLREPR
ncbi:TetR/AcrR family transcriptional regulator [Paenibacillus segetis]|uniref:TetR family transcriptional regulator n=1 Tax=Paenibacillus segetis TaxID=1325360 RepID=A0ABQ1Y4Z8_9BACL|nr:TetR/AcrR family transcriptional regulator [Paenibacillus segetis]GGH11685.1 TetR family transcriptional regulator [Paenibacillus segetis]